MVIPQKAWAACARKITRFSEIDQVN